MNRDISLHIHQISFFFIECFTGWSGNRRVCLNASWSFNRAEAAEHRLCFQWCQTQLSGCKTLFSELASHQTLKQDDPRRPWLTDRLRAGAASQSSVKMADLITVWAGFWIIAGIQSVFYCLHWCRNSPHTLSGRDVTPDVSLSIEWETPALTSLIARRRLTGIKWDK